MNSIIYLLTEFDTVSKKPLKFNPYGSLIPCYAQVNEMTRFTLKTNAFQHGVKSIDIVIQNLDEKGYPRREYFLGNFCSDNSGVSKNLKGHAKSGKRHDVLRFKYTLKFSNGYKLEHLGSTFRMFSKSDLERVNTHLKEREFKRHNDQCEQFILSDYSGRSTQRFSQGTFIYNRVGKIMKQTKMKQNLSQPVTLDYAQLAHLMQFVEPNVVGTMMNEQNLQHVNTNVKDTWHSDSAAIGNPLEQFTDFEYLVDVFGSEEIALGDIQLLHYPSQDKIDEWLL